MWIEFFVVHCDNRSAHDDGAEHDAGTEHDDVSALWHKPGNRGPDPIVLESRFCVPVEEYPVLLRTTDAEQSNRYGVVTVI